MAFPAMSAVPESGQYVDPLRPNVGFGMEVQGNKAGVVVYVYDQDGNPTFFVGGGEFVLRTDIGEAGANGAHDLVADLYRSAGGHELLERTIGPGDGVLATYSQQVVGRLSLRFIHHTKGVLTLQLNEPDSQGRTSLDRPIERVAFGVPTIGTSTNIFANACWPDLRGEWLFRSLQAPSTPEIRVSLPAPTIVSPLTCASPTAGVVEYRDIGRALTLRCLQRSDPLNTRRHDGGCELISEADGTTILSFLMVDAGVHTIRAMPGDLPAMMGGEDKLKTILGRRVD